MLLKQVFPLENIYFCPNDNHSWPPDECSIFLFALEIYNILENLYNCPVIFFQGPVHIWAPTAQFILNRPSSTQKAQQKRKYATFVLFVAQLQKNCTIFGVPLRNNGTLAFCCDSGISNRIAQYCLRFQDAQLWTGPYMAKITLNTASVGIGIWYIWSQWLW